MAQAKHLGKIVLSVRNQQVEAEPLVGQAVSFTSEATYLITGGLGGFGLAVAEWMVDNGARHLVLMGRTGAASDEAKQAIARIERQGARVVVAKADVSREDEVARVLAEITEQMPPLRGIVHAAMVLDDGIVMNLTEERFKKVMEPKMHGAWNLHRLTVNLPLEFFVLFSSGVTMMGSVGQGNYVAANAFLDALAHHRRRQGLPALAINWGALTDVGYVARRSEIAEYLDRIGQKGFTSNQATDILGRLFLRRVAQIGVMRVDWRQRAKFASTSASPRLSLFTSPDALEHQTGEERLRVRDMLLATHTEERQPIMESYLRDQVARVFGTSPSHLEPQRPLTEMGLDSLIAVELKNRIEKDLGVSLPTVELMRGPTITTLSQVLLDQLIGLDSASGTHSEPEIQRRLTSEPEKRAAGELLQHLDQLSDQQVDTLLSTLVDERELESLVAEKNQR
jgi:NAD(P)-dependent dehydrogenase (short-subunit alcohol dehydrogenase family)/aryl carrier-like protein